MSNSPFNSPLEISTRIVLMLASRPHLARDVRTIAAIDLLTTNRGDYNERATNLHGYSMIPASLASRLDLIRRAIPFAVTHGLITPHISEEETHYTVTSDGLNFVASLTSQYFSSYTSMLSSTLAFVDSHTPAQVLKVLNHPNILSEGDDRR